MRKVSIIMAIAMALTVMTASVAVAGGPTCENYVAGGDATGWKNHGEHVTSGYATPGVPGGASGGPAHFGEHPLGPGISPGATFCGPGKNQAPELLHRPNGNVIFHEGT